MQEQISKRPRVRALDILRGFFLAVIAIDHFQQFPSLFDFFTGRGMLWVSAAEGFFIISGITVGYVYMPRIAKKVWPTVIKIWKRALLLFGLSVGFTLFFTMFGRQLVGHQGLRPGLNTADSWPTIIEHTLRLQYVYGWVDFLALYSVFMLFAPIAVYLTLKKQSVLVVVISVICWLFLRDFDIRFGWQIFFMIGIVVGSHLPAINKRISQFHPKKELLLYGGLIGFCAVYLLISAYFVFSVPFLMNRPGTLLAMPQFFADIISSSQKLADRTLNAYFYKWTLPGPRVVFSFIWFSTLYLLVRKYEDSIEKLSKGIFSLFGRNSLFTYCFMGIIIFFLHLVITPKITNFNTKSLVINSLLYAVFLAVMIIAVKAKEKYFTR
jgi:hypothetical protein